MHHVLVVDDRPDICAVVQMALEADGTCCVSSAFGAEQAIAAIAED